MLSDLQYDILIKAIELTIHKLEEDLDKVNCTARPGKMFDLRGQIQGLKTALEYAADVSAPKSYIKKLFVEAESQVKSKNDYTPKGSRKNTDQKEAH